MGTAAKKIVEGLRKAKVGAEAQRRAKDLIDEAHDWDSKQAAEIEAVVRYVCGAAPRLRSPLGAEFLEHAANQLVYGLSKNRTFDEWDLRALDVLAQCRKSYWFWALDTKVRDRVEKFPQAPIFEEALEVFRARGLWKTEKQIYASMFGHLTAHLTPKKALTSTGRWLLAKLDADADAVFRIARTQKKEDETSALFRLLAWHRRALFEKLVRQRPPKEDSERSYLAEVMLEVDPKRYERQAVALLARVKAPISAALGARMLERHFPGRYRPLVKKLLLRVAKEGDTGYFDADDSGRTHELALSLAWPTLGKEAFEVWNALETVDDAKRVDFCEIIERQAKKEALPWLVDALVYPKDPNVEYGFLTHAKYVARLVKLVEKYPLGSHAARIEKAFASTTDAKIRELIDGLLGTKAKPAPKKARSRFTPKDGYRFDVYCASVTRAALAAAKKALRQLPSPIERVKLAGFQGEVQLNVLVLEGVGKPATFRLAVPASTVPDHVDSGDTGVLAKLGEAHQLSEDELPSWGDAFRLPWCVLIEAQLRAAHEIAKGLETLGCSLSEDLRVGVGEDDNFWTTDDGFEDMVRDEVSALPTAVQADFAVLCFEDVKRQRALLAT